MFPAPISATTVCLSIAQSSSPKYKRPASPKGERGASAVPPLFPGLTAGALTAISGGPGFRFGGSAAASEAAREVGSEVTAAALPP